MIQAIVMGGSAGAVDGLIEILAGLPPSFPVPIAAVVHIPRGRPSLLAGVIGGRTKLPVKEPEDKEALQGGVVYVAPANYHLLIDEGPSFALAVDDPLYFSMPAIDPLFESAAAVCGRGLIGVVLTGANADGSRGLRAILDAGGQAVVQAPEEAIVRTMPEAAIALCPEAKVLALREITRYLMKSCGG